MNEWANAQTADGSMWVWIPRYIYKISSGWHTTTTGTIDVQFSKGINDNWNNTEIGNINTDTTASSSNNTWTNHPAFTFGQTELKGIWVAKFEASNNNGKIQIVPNAVSWRGISVNNIFNNCRSMETDNTYGWGTSGIGIDTHFIKNTEWGAVAYLSKSKYGKNDIEIWNNPATGYITGRVGTALDTALTDLNYPYDDAQYGGNASTTGNIHGVYDMSGGSYEYTSAYITNGNTNLTTYGSNIVNADSKYKDIYSASSDNASIIYNEAINIKGDAIYETSKSYSGANSWFKDYSYIPSNGYVFFVRGGYNIVTSYPGIFGFTRESGVGSDRYGFRPAIAVDPSL